VAGKPQVDGQQLGNRGLVFNNKNGALHLPKAQGL
jgi:hypothetical protein